MSTHRVFGDDCTIPGGQHQIGDRHSEGRGTFLEWTGEAWTRVCPDCDTPMAGQDADGWLACDLCGLRAVDAGKR